MKRTDRIGETNLNTCGQKMTIIAYRNLRDLDVQFEDGTIIRNKQYHCFKEGNIRKDRRKSRLINRIGETSFSSRGQKMTIIAYRGSIDLDIQFEDGTIVRNRTYRWFKEGKILCDRVGEENVANCGLKMKIIAYRSATDIDVQFENGIIKHRCYANFKHGSISCKQKD